jgi:uroporphyrinogen-III synthase
VKSGILLCRPVEEAQADAATLTACGWPVCIEPMLTIAPVADPLWPEHPQHGFDALALTSPRAAVLVARSLQERGWPAPPTYVVGDATARAAVAAGLNVVGNASADSAALAQLLARSLAGRRGASVLHACGAESAGDMAAHLAANGMTLARVVLYQAQARTALSSAAAQAIGSGSIAYALLYSPRTAAILVGCMQQACVSGRGIAALCLSPAVAEAAQSRPASVSWKRLLVATHPNAKALLALLPPFPPDP